MAFFICPSALMAFSICQSAHGNKSYGFLHLPTEGLWIPWSAQPIHPGTPPSSGDTICVSSLQQTHSHFREAHCVPSLYTGNQPTEIHSQLSKDATNMGIIKLYQIKIGCTTPGLPSGSDGAQVGQSRNAAWRHLPDRRPGPARRVPESAFRVARARRSDSGRTHHRDG